MAPRPHRDFDRIQGIGTRPLFHVPPKGQLPTSVMGVVPMLNRSRGLRARLKKDADG